jgi:O-antigen/teichoic acid export membrane protein
MTARVPRPIKHGFGFIYRVKSDSLVRNSLYLMASTVMTAGLGYVFWAIVAHTYSKQEVGIGGAVISLCSTAALLTYLGSYATLIERLPASEGSSEWTAILVRMSLLTAGVTAVATAAAVPLLLRSHNYYLFFSSTLAIVLAVAGAAAWTLVNLLGAAFIAARRAGRLLFVQTLISSAKILFVLLLAAAGAHAIGLVGAWVSSTILGIFVGVVWLVPRMGLGRRTGNRPHRRAVAAAEPRRRPHRRPRHRRALAAPSAGSIRHLLGQHLTSVGGAVTPLVLPVLVVLRLGVTQNAYFYITQMMGAAFFMISPAVASAVFAEGVRASADLRGVIFKALRIIVMLLAPAMIVMIAAGKFILGLFGHSYGTAGYGLLILLAISALPDAVSNVAVVVFRVTQRLGYSATLNLGILVMTLTGAWILMPRFGIAGVGAAWLGAQIVGAIASLPAYIQIGKPMELDAFVAETNLDAGIAQLIYLANLQSRARQGGRPPDARENTTRVLVSTPDRADSHSVTRGLQPTLQHSVTQGRKDQHDLRDRYPHQSRGVDQLG